MERADIVPALEAERLRLADVLDDLAPEEWPVPSLCGGWSVKVVVAHMTLVTRLSRLTALRALLGARGNIDGMIDRVSRARAAQYSPAELIAQFRESAGSARRPPGAKPMDPLVDVLVHGQDITRPLHRTYPMAVEYVVPALEFVVSTKFYGARKRLAGLRLIGTDVDRSFTDGEREVRGPVGELLLVATGRSAGLAALSGDGVDELAARL
ncbi:MAG TPA: maleylpyruvate isomerase family mycothiol-dependent enzyme [Actinomycetospora sp.]|nr:maleylpyruvate isomerase family mycothiol-dependent enzyme [Actinomycetospora sp.]